MLTILSNSLRSSHEYKVSVHSGQIRRHDVIHASLFHFGYHDQYLEKLTLCELVIVRRNVGRKKRQTLYERCKVRRKTRLIQHSIHVRKNVC